MVLASMIPPFLSGPSMGAPGSRIPSVYVVTTSLFVAMILPSFVKRFRSDFRAWLSIPYGRLEVERDRVVRIGIYTPEN